MYYLLLGVSVEVPGNAFKIILATFSVFALINITAYSAGLISFLTSTKIIMPFKTIDEFFQNDKYHFSSLRNFTDLATRFHKFTEVFSPILASSSCLPCVKFHFLHCHIVSKRSKQAAYQELAINKKFTIAPVGTKYSSLYETIGDSMFVIPTEICDYITMVYEPNFIQVFRHMIKWDRRIIFMKNFPHDGLFLKTWVSSI